MNGFEDIFAVKSMLFNRYYTPTYLCAFESIQLHVE